MSESVERSLLIEANVSLDTGLRARLEELSLETPAVYNQLKVLKGINEVLRDRFFASGRTENPNLRATHSDEDALAMQEAAWLTFKQETLSASVEPEIKQAYRWVINEAIANTRLTHYSAAGDMRRFEAYNEFIYGQPDPEIFAAVADWFRNNAATYADDERPDVREAAKKVLELVPDLRGDRNALKPSAEVFEKVRRRHYSEKGYFALLLAGVELPSEGKVPREVGDPAIRQALQNIGSDLDIIHSDAAGFAVNRHKGGVESPVKYSWVLRRFVGLPLGHELGHELEYQNGIRQRLSLFGPGLDRYESGNEGRAVIREQLPYETFDDFAETLRWQDIMRRHFAVCLGAGTGGEAMDFSQAFEVLSAVDRLWERKKKGADTAEADTKADSRTWDLLSTKVFVGTDGQAGAVYMKNGVYLSGNVACWRAAERSPGLIEQGDFGKFDITNPRHIALAQKFGVLPAFAE
jgi:hypothetical protein